MTEWLDLNKAVMSAIARGELEEADALLPLLEGEARVRGEKQLVCNSHFTRGLVRDAQRRYREAEEAFEDCLALDERLHGRDSVSAADTLHSLGLVRASQDDHEGALAASRRAAEIYRAKQPFQLTHALSTVASRLLKLERFAEALAAYDDALASARKEPKTPHHDVARCLLGAGEVLRQRAWFPEAFSKLAMATQMARPNMWPTLADCVTRAWYTLGIVSCYGLQNSRTQAALAFWYALVPGAAPEVIRAASAQLMEMPEREHCVGDRGTFRLVYRDDADNLHVASAAHGLFHLVQPLDAAPGDAVDVELENGRAVRVSAR